ncbi:MAG: hypothetical protein ACR2I2_06155 [Bryobacteraceae bacterium]
MFVFRDDGTLQFSPGAVVESKYRVEGNRLITPPGTINGPEDVTVIETLTQNELRLLASVMGMTREGGVVDPKNLIWGTWQIKSGNKDSVKWQFRADGTQMLSNPGAVRGKYRLEGNRLILPPATVNGPEPVMAVVSLTENELRLVSVMRMTREGKVIDPKNLILGTWQWQPTSDGMPMRRQFRANGTDLLTAPFRTDKGRYTIRDDRIRIEIDGYPVVEGNLRWEDEVLVLPGPSGSGESRFARY